MAAYNDIVGLVLAAGLSSRMGEFKPLLPIGGKTLIESAVGSLLDSGVGEVVVVTGHRAEDIEALLAGRPEIRLVRNPNFMQGMFTSVKAGVRAMDDRFSAFLMMPGDYPNVNPETVGLLCREYREKSPLAVLPSHNGKTGHPALFSLRLKDEILKSDPPRGMKSILQNHQSEISIIETGDPGILLDLDNKEDYERALLCVRREGL